MFGIVKSLLPEGVVIFRLAHHQSSPRGHYAPNFERWLDRVPLQSAGVIVSRSTPFTRFDCATGARVCRACANTARRTPSTILAAWRAVHYRVLDQQGVMELMETEDLCPDLEFAIARAWK